jgi:hypothetical protein
MGCATAKSEDAHRTPRARADEASMDPSCPWMCRGSCIAAMRSICRTPTRSDGGCLESGRFRGRTVRSGAVSIFARLSRELLCISLETDEPNVVRARLGRNLELNIGVFV